MIPAFPWWFIDRFADLPVIHTKKSRWSDDDAEFHSDVSYMRDLLQDISELCYCRRLTVSAPTHLFDSLAAATDELATASKMIRERTRA